MPATYYPAVVDRSASGYGVSFPDFPGLVAAGDTVHDAALSAEIGLSLHLKGMIEDKDDIPAPSSLDDIEAIEGAEDVARILVRAETPAKFSRVQVTLEDSLLAAIDAHAANRSGFLSQAAWTALRNGHIEFREHSAIPVAAKGASKSISRVSGSVTSAVSGMAKGTNRRASRGYASSASEGKAGRKEGAGELHPAGGGKPTTHG